MQLLITCSLDEKGEINETLQKWFQENIPDIDYSTPFNLDEDEETGDIGIGSDVFYNENGDEELDCFSDEYQIAMLENDIQMIELYIMLSEIELPDGIEGFDIDNGAQFGYNKKVEIAKLDLEKSEKELSDLRTSFSALVIT